MGKLIHSFDPIVDGGCRILVLGTMPGEESLRKQQYYGHPRNAFWPIMARLCDRELPEDYALRKAMLLDAGIALWDVLAACNIAGASDASIANPEPNDLARILDAAPIETVCTTGGKAAQLCRRFDGPVLTQRGIELVELPSTSPANARMRLDDLVAAARRRDSVHPNRMTRRHPTSAAHAVE